MILTIETSRASFAAAPALSELVAAGKAGCLSDTPLEQPLDLLDVKSRECIVRHNQGAIAVTIQEEDRDSQEKQEENIN